MIKKINILLILIASLGGIYCATKETNIAFILKDVAIVLTINLIYILQKVFKFKISDKLNLVYIIFIFAAHFLGVIVDLYSKIYWYDKFIHFLSGIMTSIAAIFILSISNQNKKKSFNILFIISFSMLIASFWEIFEYVSSILFNVDPQKVALTGINDTMGDIIIALLGSLCVSIVYSFNNELK